MRRLPWKATAANVPRRAGLEPPGRAGRDVQPEPVGGRPVEIQRGVGVRQVQVRADLDGPVAGVDDHQLDPFGVGAVGVEFDGAGRDADRAGPGG